MSEMNFDCVCVTLLINDKLFIKVGWHNLEFCTHAVLIKLV